MGRNLLLNMADHGFKVIGFDQDPEKGKCSKLQPPPGTTVKGGEYTGRNGEAAASST